MIHIISRAVLVWLVFVLGAVLNGAVREKILIRFGDRPAHMLSSVILSAVIFILTLLFIPFIGVTTPLQCWSIGLLWLSLTVAFEFLFGHYVAGVSWGRLRADYNILAGRLWLLVIATVLVSPIITGRIRSLV